MAGQTYQEVSKIVLEGLKDLSKHIDLNISEIAIQDYFFNKKNENPEKYERLFFDTNGHSPYSKDLSDILFDFKLAGIIDSNNRCAEE